LKEKLLDFGRTARIYLPTEIEYDTYIPEEVINKMGYGAYLSVNGKGWN
jgi:hypothetical protein